MVRSIYVPQAGDFIDFKDDAADADIVSYINEKYPQAKPTEASEEAPPPAASWSLKDLEDQFTKGVLDVVVSAPGGIASMLPESMSKTRDWLDEKSRQMQSSLDSHLQVNKEAENTTAAQAANIAGQVGGFLIPGVGVGSAILKGATKGVGIAQKLAKLEKGAVALNKGGKAIVTGQAALQGAVINADHRRQQIEEQRKQGMPISKDQEMWARRFDFAIGTLEAAPMERFIGPLTKVLSKVPASEAPIVERLLESRLSQIVKSGTAEAAQEAISGVLSDIAEKNIYNPNVVIGQDLMSNIAAGGAAGGIIEALIQTMAGKRARGFKQLEQDMAKEATEGDLGLRQAQIVEGVQRLTEAQAFGPVDIVNNAVEIDGQLVEEFSVQDRAGNKLFNTYDPAVAADAIAQYKEQYKANIFIRESVEDNFPKPGKITIDPKSGQPVRTSGPTLEESFPFGGKMGAKITQAAPVASPIPPSPHGTQAAVETPEAAAPAGMTVDLQALQGAATGETQTQTGTQATPTPEAPQEIAPPGPQVVPPSTGLDGLPVIPTVAEPQKQAGTLGATAQPGEAAIGDASLIKNRFPEAQPTAETAISPPAATPIADMDYDPPLSMGMEAVVPSPDKPQKNPQLAQERKQRIDAVATAVNNRLRSIGLGDVGVKLSGYLRDDGFVVRAKGSETIEDGRSVIELAVDVYDPKLSTEQLVDEIMKTLDHEMIHSMISLGVIRPSELAMLQRAVERTMVAGKKYTYIDRAQAIYGEEGNPDLVYEEAIADLFKDWRRNSSAAPPPVRGLLNRMLEVLKRIFHSFKAMKYGDHNNLFQKIEDGEVGQRERELVSDDGKRFSAIAKPEFKKWFEGSALVNDDGTPKKMYHGTSKDTPFTAFKAGKRGIWFTDDPSVASMYAVENDAADNLSFDHMTGTYERKHTAARVIPAYLSIKKPYTPTPQDDDLLRRSPNYAAAQRMVFDKARARGHDGVDMGEGVWVAFSPEQVKSVFNQFEEGESKSKRFSLLPSRSAPENSAWVQSGAPEAGRTSVNKSGSSPYVISQRRPSAKKTIGQSLKKMLVVDLQTMEEDPKAFAHNVELLKEYPDFPVKRGESTHQTAQRFIDQMASNLVYLHNRCLPDVCDMSQRWYDGSRSIVDQITKQYNMPDTAVAAVIASLSPQKDWYQNVSLAKRLINIVKTKGGHKFDGSMMAKALSIKALEPYRLILDAMEQNELTLDQLTKPNFEAILHRKANEIAAGEFDPKVLEEVRHLGPALFVRLYDETYNERSYPIITPLGEEVKSGATKSGELQKVAWGSLMQIDKAIRSMSGQKSDIDAILGEKHKIRNFYNNILAPNSKDGSITIDTHAVAAAHLRPLSGNDLETSRNFGTNIAGTRNVSTSKATGVSGLYPLYAEAYRKAAKEIGILPRQLQSVTWEAIRGIFPKEFKKSKKNVKQINDIWRGFKDGQKTVDQVRSEINAITGEIKPPFWYTGNTGAKPRSGVHENDGPSNDAQHVHRAELAGDASKRTGSGELGGNPKRTGVKRYSLSPAHPDVRMDPYLEQQDAKLFAQPVKKPVYERIMEYFFEATPMTSGHVVDAIRTHLVDRDTALLQHERKFNEITKGGRERLSADFSAYAAMQMARRASHVAAAALNYGAPVVKMSVAGDLNSAYVKVEESPDSIAKVAQILMNGPDGQSLMNVFRAYAVAKRGARLETVNGKEIPIQIDQKYRAKAFAEAQKYPQVIEAYEMYQRYNKKLIDAAADAGVISPSARKEYTANMDHYSFYREFGEEMLGQSSGTKIAGAVRVIPYKGSKLGNLAGDPLMVMIHNSNFWVGAIMKNIASRKAFNLLSQIGEARQIGGNASPNLDDGEFNEVMHMKVDGVPVRYVVKDPLLAKSLGSDDRIDMSKAFQLLGMPTKVLRESVTRDPVFILRNLMRDTLSTWVLRGEDFKPFISTLNGFQKALRKESSYKALMGFGVVGSYDESMKTSEQMSEALKMKALPKNVLGINSGNEMLRSIWHKLGDWSEASDAASRIPVYEAVLKETGNEAEAAFRALEMMNFARSGSSQVMNILIKLVPFLNARIQGLDVVAQSIGAATRYVQGRPRSDRDANMGKRFLVRGMMLMAISVALEKMLMGDEFYENLDEYLKTANLLVPLGGDKYLAIPKPFETGLIWSTIPQNIYRYQMGEKSGREMAQLFWDQFAATFGVNPVPQLMLPLVENTLNHDFYTGLPLISNGKLALDPSLQYNASTSSVVRQIAEFVPTYNFTTGRFEQMSPILLENLITGYGGPLANYITAGVSTAMRYSNTGPDALPKEWTNVPGVRSFYVEASGKNAKSITEAYQVYNMVDQVNRTFNRLVKMGDIEAARDYMTDNASILGSKKYINKVVDTLNKITAMERMIERSPMSDEEKLAQMKYLRQLKVEVTKGVPELNRQLGR